MNAFRTKTVEQSIQDTEEPGHKLRRSLSALDLVVFGVGVVIGTGIFVLTGKAAGTTAGPAVAISFVVAGLVCGLAAMCYAELASTVPVAGCAYTFSYATLGELVAWIIGWDLILELALGRARSWPAGRTTSSTSWTSSASPCLVGLQRRRRLRGAAHSSRAAVIVLLLTGVICLGIKVSARVNVVIIDIKVAIVLLVIIAGLFFINVGQLSPFIPPSPAPGRRRLHAGGSSRCCRIIGFGAGSFGVAGIFTAAALVFFAFIGFDIVATAAEETRNPQRDMPRGILGSLAICTTLYVAVSLVHHRHGAVRQDRGGGAARRRASGRVGADAIATIISVGALAGLTTVMMILLLGQSRVFFAMSRDRLLPPFFSAVSPRFGTPIRATVVTGVVVAIVAALIPLSRARRDGQRRHAVRLRPRGDRRHPAAQQPSRPAAVVPGAVDAVAADPVGAGHDLPDAQPARRSPGCGSSSGCSSGWSSTSCTARAAAACSRVQARPRPAPEAGGPTSRSSLRSGSAAMTATGAEGSTITPAARSPASHLSPRGGSLPSPPTRAAAGLRRRRAEPRL